jgi:hypothetical protein
LVDQVPHRCCAIFLKAHAFNCHLLKENVMRRANSKEGIERNVAKDWPMKNERDKIRARLRKKYADLQPAKVVFKAKDRRRFEELGKLMDLLEACENRRPNTRS